MLGMCSTVTTPESGNMRHKYITRQRLQTCRRGKGEEDRDMTIAELIAELREELRDRLTCADCACIEQHFCTQYKKLIGVTDREPRCAEFRPNAVIKRLLPGLK